MAEELTRQLRDRYQADHAFQTLVHALKSAILEGGGADTVRDALQVAEAIADGRIREASALGIHIAGVSVRSVRLTCGHGYTIAPGDPVPTVGAPAACSQCE